MNGDTLGSSSNESDTDSTISDSSLHQSTFTSISKRRRQFELLDVIHDYNLTMGGVDKLAQIIDPFTTVRKSSKWYKKIFFMFLDFAVHNAFILYSQNHDVSRRQFFNGLISGLISRGSTLPRRLSAHGDTPSRLLHRNDHFLTIGPETGKYPYRRCFVCSQRKKRKDTKYVCEPCGNIPLCAVPCFQNYHSLETFWVFFFMIFFMLCLSMFTRLKGLNFVGLYVTRIWQLL